MGLHVGIDTGGTFTDLVVFDSDTGDVRSLKTLSTPSEPGRAILNVLFEAELSNPAIDDFTHGTTVGTNALIERTGCRVAFLTTKGFEDIPYIQRINRKVLYDLQWQKPEPLVASRRFCFGINERLSSTGEVVRPVDEAEVRNLCHEMARQGVEAIAICLLFSYVNTLHEEQVKYIVREELGDIPLSISHEVAPIWREYERASTTIADAYLKPLLSRYVRSLDQALRGAGVRCSWAIMKSNGGVMDSMAAAHTPIQTVMSGPAAGMIASQELANLIGEHNIITLDMGGTSADVGIIVEGQQRHTTEYEIEWGLPASIPLIDIKSIGAGGGSIAWVDTAGFLRVGPRSAGAQPGPICYGRGGREVTVTDANLFLGRLDAEYFLAGRMQLDASLIKEPMDALATRLGMDPIECAASVVEIANENMASAIKMVSLERGHDPRRFALLAFGGAGPLHAVAIARRMGIPRVIVPPYPGAFSALGLLLADIRVDKVWTQAFRSTAVDSDLVDRQFRRITEQALAELRREGFTGEPEIRRAITMRYLGQNYEHEVELPPGPLDDESLAAAFRSFNDLHAKRYGYCIEGEVIELVSFKVTTIGRRLRPNLRQMRESSTTEEVGIRPVFFRNHGFVKTAIFRRQSLQPGHAYHGPAVIEEEGSTTIVEPEMRFEVSPEGLLLISVEAVV